MATSFSSVVPRAGGLGAQVVPPPVAATPPTTGAGGSPASGVSWVPPTPANNVTTPVYGTSTTASRPDLASFLQNDLSAWTNPNTLGQGNAPTDISSILTQEAQSHLQLFPGTGDPSQIAALVQQLQAQYAQAYAAYQAQSQPQTAQAQAPQANLATPAQLLPPSANVNPVTGVVNGTAGTPHISDLNQLIYSPTAAAGSPASTPNTTTPPATTRGGDTIISSPTTTPGINPSAPASATTPTTAPPSMLTNGVGGVNPVTGEPIVSNSGIPSGQTPDQFLAQTVANGGNPVDVLPAWQAMQAAQQQTIDRGMQQLKASFGASGNRFSTGFGTSASDFMNQAVLNQNSQLTQAQLQSLTDAANRQMTAGQQLSTQSFQAAMQATNNNLSAALALLQTGYGAAGQIAGTQATAGLTAAQQYTQLLQMGLSSAQALAVLNQQNLQTGAGLGAQQQTLAQQATDRQVTQYFQSLPQFNPLMPYFQQGANTYPQLFNQQFPISQLGAILGGVGSLLGIAPSLISSLKKLFTSNDPSSTLGGVMTGPLPSDTEISLSQLFGIS